MSEFLLGPLEFHARLLAEIKQAKSRIVIATLYLGPEQHALIEALEERFRAGVHVRVIVDANRGSRDSQFHPKFPLQLVSPSRLSIGPSRLRESLGTQHAKFCVFDDDKVIITGANLSETYFTNRHDRYLVLSNVPNLANWLADYPNSSDHNEVDKLSNMNDMQTFKQKLPNLSSHNADCELSNRSNLKQIKHKLPNMANYNELDKLPKKMEHPISIHTNKQDPIVKNILEQADPTSRIFLSSPYLNISSEIFGLLSKFNHVSIITGTMEANAFWGATGVAKIVPQLYESLKREIPQNASLLEYDRPGWSFHAKGIWVQTGTTTTCVIGSSNFGYRSRFKDCELSLLVEGGQEDLNNVLQWTRPARPRPVRPWISFLAKGPFRSLL